MGSGGGSHLPRFPSSGARPLAVLYLLLFADDGLLMAASPEYFKVVVALLFLDLMEVPLSWRKTRGGFQAEWIGYTIDLRSWRIGISDKKVQWLVSWAERSHLLGREFRAGVGRLGFLAGALSGVRPFLAPLYAVAPRVGGSSYVELHLAVKIAIQFFDRLGGSGANPRAPSTSESRRRGLQD